MTDIIVTISPDGTPSIEVLNGDGKTCTQLTEKLEKALGQIQSREFKPEHRQNSTGGVRLKA